MSSDLSVRVTEGWMESGPGGGGAGREGQSRQSPAAVGDRTVPAGWGGGV